jgi:hypothetical protein
MVVAVTFFAVVERVDYLKVLGAVNSLENKGQNIVDHVFIWQLRSFYFLITSSCLYLCLSTCCQMLQ